MVHATAQTSSASDVTILVSPAEPKELRTLGTTSFAVEEYGADFLIVGPAGIVGVQRKAFPGDLLSSMSDGRLHTLTMKLPATTLPIILLEGQPQWTSDGDLLADYGDRKLSRKALRSIVWSLQLQGISVQWTDSKRDTAEFIRALAVWWSKDKHQGFGARPGVETEWGRAASPRAWGKHLLQGFDGIGPKMAGRIYDEFDGVPLAWTVTETAMGKVRGIGPKRLDALAEQAEFKRGDDDES